MISQSSHPINQISHQNSGNILEKITELTSQERKIFRLTIDELSCKEIAESLCISVETVKKHRKNILKKLDIKGKVDFRKALRQIERSGWSFTNINYPQNTPKLPPTGH